MRTTLTLLAFTALAACTQNNSHSEKSAASENAPVAFTNTVVASVPEKRPAILSENGFAYADPAGYYVGMFEASEYNEEQNVMWSNKITIAIDKIEGDKIEGHSVVAGNLRPFSGSVKRVNGTYEAVAKEPGDNKYDGAFTFIIDGDYLKLNGDWVANNTSLPVKKRTYNLERRDFKYDASSALPDFISEMPLYGTYDEKNDKSEGLTEDAIKYNASVQVLKSRDIENMYRADLEVMRNAIYARHGYSFKNRKMREIFDNYVDWYMPVSVDVTAQLTETEKQNIELIKRYEEHAKKYYDVFGR